MLLFENSLLYITVFIYFTLFFIGFNLVTFCYLQLSAKSVLDQFLDNMLLQMSVFRVTSNSEHREQTRKGNNSKKRSETN